MGVERMVGGEHLAMTNARMLRIGVLNVSVVSLSLIGGGLPGGGAPGFSGGSVSALARGGGAGLC